MDVLACLRNIHDVLQSHPGDSAAWIASVIDLHAEDEARFYQALNSKRMWGGAGSVANQALADNPGIDEQLWLQEVRGFRELMIELGTHLQAHGEAYPDISSWLLAFHNWNQSGI
jgi:hypothetical protein